MDPNEPKDGTDLETDVDANAPFQEVFLNELLLDAGLGGSRRRDACHRTHYPLSYVLPYLPIAYPGGGRSEGENPFQDSAEIALPMTVTKEQEELELECSICWQELEEGDAASALPCDHIFHEDCLDVWLEHHGTCPTCRTFLADATLPQSLDPDLAAAPILVAFSSDDSSEISEGSSFSFGSEYDSIENCTKAKSFD